MNEPNNSEIDIHTLLPVRALVVTLKFNEEAHFKLFHQAAVHAFIRHLLGSPSAFNTLLTLDAPESGRGHYRPGDCYRFTVYALSGGETLLLYLINQLHKLPGCAPVQDLKAPLRNNLQLEALHDLSSEQPVQGIQDLTLYDGKRLESEVDNWKTASLIRLRWLSPVRLLKVKSGLARSKGEARYCQESADINNNLLLYRLQNSIASLLQSRGEPRPRLTMLQTIPPQPAHLFWVDNEYSDKDSNSKPMGGMAGEILLGAGSIYTQQQLRQLVLGQYLGVGQRRAFGLGRYQLETVEGAKTLPVARSPNSLMQRVVEDENLYNAYLTIRDNQKKRGAEHLDVVAQEEEWWLARYSDMPDPDEEEQLADRLQRLGKTLINGPPERPVPLDGIVFREEDGDLRALAIPPFWERVAQRAVTQQLAPLLETVMSPHSYGYRRGYSRQGASLDIQRAWRDGYRWVYEADIDDFFDNVDWHRLELRLRTLLRDDPLVEYLLSWISAPVNYQGFLVQRGQGLPQGAPISPLLANLFLDDLDSDLETAGFHLVRFADDFVVLCKDRQQADEASHRVLRSLTDLGLELNEEKSRVVAFEQGFRYLGYLFMNELVLDTSGSNEQYKYMRPPQPLPPNSWLARLGRRSPEALQKLNDFTPGAAELKPDAVKSDAEQRLWLGERDDRGTLLMLTGKPILVSTRDGRLIADRDDRTLQETPWAGLAAVLLIGNHHITTPALREAMKQQVPVHLANSSGRYQGAVWNGRAGAQGVALWLRQQIHCSDVEQALPVARQLVMARIRHMRELLRQRRPLERKIRQTLQDAVNQAGKAQNLDALNGIEGSATRHYFKALAKLVPEAYGFTGRNRRPPRDPFNALLSLGYTLLYSHTETLLRVDGLYPWIGCYHQPHGNHAALASDMMEPFRHLVERTALSAVTQQQLKPGEFTLHPQQGCRLSPQALRRYLAMLWKRFDTPLTAVGETEPLTPLTHLHRQNIRLIDWLRDDNEFRAWISR